MKINVNIPKDAFINTFTPFLKFIKHPKMETIVLYGGAATGKSKFATQMMTIKAMKEKRKILIIRKVARTLKDSIWTDFLDTIETFGMSEHVKINKTNFTMTFPNGSVLMFKGLDDPEKIKSISGVDDILVEEATEITADDYKQLTLRIGRKKTSGRLRNQFVLCFNPIGKWNWVYKTWGEYIDNPKKPRPKNLVIHKSYYWDNHFLSSTTIENIEEKKNSDKNYWKIYGLGEFASLDKRVIEDYKVEEFTLDSLIAEYGKQTLIDSKHLGLDFGYVNDPTAFVFLFYIESVNKVYIYDTFYEKGLTNQMIAEEIKKRGYQNNEIIADSAELKSIHDLQDNHGIRRVVPAEKGPGSVNQGIDFLNTCTIIVHPKNKEYIEELENYVWIKDKKTGEYINKPEDRNNHLIDATRYALEGIYKNVSIKTLILK